MGVIQINILTCDICSRIETVTDVAELYESRPIGAPFDEVHNCHWDHITYKNDRVLACPECVSLS